MTPPIVLTGATGFVGGAVALELLAQTDAILICLVRARRPGAPEGPRLRDALAAAARAYDRADLLEAIADRCVAIEGNLSARTCGVIAARLRSAGAFVHCAASPQYEDRHRDAIVATNVGGTANALELAHAAGIPAFQYVSTAYVAGDRTGLVEENAVADGTRVNNCYEESKVRAEALVAASPIPARQIVRPAVVIGHSKTLSATSFSGLYGFIAALLAVRRRIEARLGNSLRCRPIRFEFARDHEINFIPVDAVAGATVRLLAAATPGETYHHVANVTPPVVGESLSLLCEELGMARPEYSCPSADLSSIDLRIRDGIRFYQSYLRNPKVFDTSATEAIVGRETLTCGLEPEALLAHARWYLERLREAPAVALGRA